MAEKLTLALTILLTGFVVVFAVLFLLIGVIKLYGTIVYKAQNRNKTKKEQNSAETVAPVQVIENTNAQLTPSTDDEIIAVIAAAVDSIYGPSKAKIKSIRKTGYSRSAWSNTGLLESTRPF